METDQIKIETEFMKGIISKAIQKAVWNCGYVMEIQISELNAVNKNGKIDAHLTANVRTSSGEFKRICNNSDLLKNLLSTVLKFKFLKKLLIEEGSKIIKKLLAKKLGEFDLTIKKLDYDEKGGKSSVYLDAFVQIKEKELKKVLKL